MKTLSVEQLIAFSAVSFTCLISCGFCEDYVEYNELRNAMDLVEDTAPAVESATIDRIAIVGVSLVWALP